ncbi:hypothetical protein L6452_19228 [Arctium lappa]|uniref:Uncharacterized protein n=1 Tax=Arctium lappa TaxID=4217 RepID=A0ACB9B9D3_ARCLA|nr:hypothetical protein L6452_19228 [Arctium lappa]
MKTPLAPSLKLHVDPDGVSVDITGYRGMIGSLLYLTASRPYIMFATCLCARYQANPKESHLAAVKRIFRYLKGTKIDRKSTTGSCQLLGGKLVSWSSKKQNSFSTSTAEAEYVAAVSCCAQILWMKNQLRDYNQLYSHIPILRDNSNAIVIANNPVLHSRSKHIDIRYHFIRHHISKGDIELHFIPTDLQLADLFTKPIDEARFKFLIGELGMLNAGIDPKHSAFDPIASFLLKSPLHYTLTYNPPKITKLLIGNFWLTCVYDPTPEKVSTSILSDPASPDLTLGVEDVCSALHLSIYSPYEKFPLGNEHEEVVAALNYIRGEHDRSPGTLLRKNMGGIWHFFFSLVILCLSKKTGGHDQCPSYITQLAHALIFQRKIDFARYFFRELVSVITPQKRPHVAFPRFISLIIYHKLATATDASHSITFDYKAPIMTRPLLHKGPLVTDSPLLPGMVSFLTSPNLQWGDAKDTPVSKGTSSVVDPSPSPLVTSASTISSSATDTAALSQTAIPPKGSSVVTQVSSAIPHTPSSDSSQSTNVDIVPFGPGDSDIPTATTFVSSQKDATVIFGDPQLSSSTLSLVDEDDFVFSPDQGSAFSLHDLSPDQFLVDVYAPPGETRVLPKASVEGISQYLAYFQQGRKQMSPSAIPSTSDVGDTPPSAPINPQKFWRLCRKQTDSTTSWGLSFVNIRHF